MRVDDLSCYRATPISNPAFQLSWAVALAEKQLLVSNSIAYAHVKAEVIMVKILRIEAQR